jgi:large conductance mechanosensitive channel
MPPLGLLIGGLNFSDMAVTLGTDPKGAPVLLKYGAFLQTMFDFLIIAIVIFIAIRGINKLKKPPPPAADAPPPRQEVLLEQIRDAIINRR